MLLVTLYLLGDRFSILSLEELAAQGFRISIARKGHMSSQLCWYFIASSNLGCSCVGDDESTIQLKDSPLLILRRNVSPLPTKVTQHHPFPQLIYSESSPDRNIRSYFSIFILNNTSRYSYSTIHAISNHFYLLLIMEVSISSLQGTAPALVTNLPRLPPEIVHQVIDNLPLFKVLHLLSHKTPYAERCVRTHRHLGKLFQSPSDVASVIDYFILLRDIRQFTHRWLKEPVNTFNGQNLVYAHAHYNNIMSWNYSIAGSSAQFPIDVLRDFLIASIRDHLRLDTLDLDLLRPYASTDYPGSPIMLNSSCEDLLIRWLWIKEAKKRLNAVKAGQLDRVTDLIMAYPGKVMLKKPLDPSQEGPRPNVLHIANTFRSNAKRMLRDSKFVHSPPNCRCTQGVDLIELVPYDQYLWLFLETLEKHPPADDIEGVAAALQRVTLTEAMGTSSLPDRNIGEAQTEKYRYPDDITANITLVVDGLFYVYTGSQLIVPRIQFLAAMKPYSVNNVKNPRFFIESKPHSAHLPENIHRCLVRKRKPYDEREYEWLEAFLKVVTWMEKQFGDDDSEGLRG